MKNTTIYVVRHGESEHNRDGIVSGHVNPALTDTGKEQASETAKLLSHIHFDEAYSSDLARARHTGEIIYGQKIPDEHQLKNLRERHFGAFEGKPGQLYQDSLAADADKREQLSVLEQWNTPHKPDMESDHAVSSRFIKTLQGIALNHPGKTILVAAHGATMRTMLIALGYLKQANLPSGAVQNAAFVELAATIPGLKVVRTHNIANN